MAAGVSSSLQEKQETVNHFVEEAVRLGMHVGLREPILEAVESTKEETVEAPSIVESTTDDQGAGGRQKAAMGIVAFLAMFAVIYVALRRMTRDSG